MSREESAVDVPRNPHVMFTAVKGGSGAANAPEQPQTGRRSTPWPGSCIFSEIFHMENTR